MTPPPTPCTARAAMSTPASFAIPQPKDATVNITSPIVNTSRRPKRSASDPAASTVVASVSAYASTTHCNCAKLASRSRWISGSATFTTVMSSNNMKIAVQTAINVHHLRSSPSTARGYFPGDPHRNANGSSCGASSTRSSYCARRDPLSRLGKANPVVLGRGMAETPLAWARLSGSAGSSPVLPFGDPSRPRRLVKVPGWLRADGRG